MERVAGTTISARSGGGNAAERIQNTKRNRRTVYPKHVDLDHEHGNLAEQIQITKRNTRRHTSYHTRPNRKRRLKSTPLKVVGLLPLPL